MALTYFSFSLMCFTIMPVTVAAGTGTHLKSLMTQLFTTNNYRTDVRPSTDLEVQLDLFLEIYLMGINSLDVVAQKMTTTAYLNLYWTDEFLTWDPTNYGNITYIYVPQHKIWRPDLSLQNGFTKLKELGDNFLLANVESTGMVHWRPFEIFETKCEINIKYFPFDVQTCRLEFGAWMTSLADVDVDVGKKGFNMEDYQKSDEWSIVSTSSESTESKTDGAKVIFTIKVKRIPNYYILNIILPVLFLSILLNFTFVLPADSGEKIGYTMTVYLSFAVFLTIVSSSFPVTSSTSIMSAYLIFLLSVGTVIVMLTVLELRLHHRSTERPIPTIAKTVVRLSWYMQCRKVVSNNAVSSSSKMVSNKEDKENGPDVGNFEVKTQDLNQDITWPDVTSAIDFFCFYLFFFMIIFVTLYMLLTAAYQ